jgi:hypothetical protein
MQEFATILKALGDPTRLRRDHAELRPLQRTLPPAHFR